MPPTPIVFRTTHRVRFSDLDTYDHMTTGAYATYYVDHRMQGLRDRIGWDLQTIATLPFMVWVRRLEIDYIRPVREGQDLTITSFVREFRGPDAVIECTMVDEAGKNLSRCLMTVAYVDRASNRATDWPADVVALFFERDGA
jgi:acyl-CoA thioester hydrolase